MRVLHIQKVNGIGGSERHLLSLLPGLAEAGLEVRMCVAATGRARDFTDRLGELGVPHSVVRAGPHANPLLVGALMREIRRFQPDLVHTHLIHADLHGQLAARLAGVPAVSSVHGAPSFYRREPYRGARRIAGGWAQRTIAISEHVRHFVEDLSLSRGGAVRVVPYGIDASGWVAANGERASTRSALGLEPGDVAIGVASRLIPGKGHGFLFEAYAKASREVARLRLLVAGDGPLRPDLERAAQGMGDRVQFLGFVADVMPFMNACDVFAFPTQPELGEGFGLAALEAMAAARPVIATAVGSLPEIVQPQRTGLIVDPRSVEDLAAALVRLADSATLRRELGEHGRRRARIVFSLEAMVERTLAVYDEAR